MYGMDDPTQVVHCPHHDTNGKYSSGVINIQSSIPRNSYDELTPPLTSYAAVHVIQTICPKLSNQQTKGALISSGWLPCGHSG